MRSALVLSASSPCWSLGACRLRAPTTCTLTIKDHKFTPAEIKVPANKRVTITVVNDDATPEEFESNALKVEKVIAGKSKGIVRIGPLKPGPLSLRRRVS